MGKRRISAVRISLVVVTVFMVATVGCMVWIISSTKNFIFEDINTIPHNNAGLLLSTEYYYSGSTPNLLFENCIKATADLYRAGRIKHIIIGGTHNAISSEYATMKAALVAQDIHESAITITRESSSVAALFRHIHNTMNIDSLTVIADPSSIHRIVFVGRKCGMSAIAYCSQDTPWQYAMEYRVHELFANIRTITDNYFF